MADQKPEAGTDPAGADAPKYVTIEDVKALLDKRDKTILSKFDTGFGELKALLAAKPAEPEPQATEAGDGKGTPAEDTPVIRGLRKELEQVKAERKAEAEARAADAAAAADAKLRHKLGEVLVDNGVEPKAAKLAVMLLVDGEKRVRFDNGEIVFRDGREDVDLATGVKSWLKSEDAMRFRAPLGTAGSGDRPPPKGSAGVKHGKGPYDGMTYEELAVKFREALTGQGSVAIG